MLLGGRHAPLVPPPVKKARPLRHVVAMAPAPVQLHRSGLPPAHSTALLFSTHPDHDDSEFERNNRSTARRAGSMSPPKIFAQATLQELRLSREPSQSIRPDSHPLLRCLATALWWWWRVALGCGWGCSVAKWPATASSPTDQSIQEVALAQSCWHRTTVRCKLAPHAPTLINASSPALTHTHTHTLRPLGLCSHSAAMTTNVANKDESLKVSIGRVAFISPTWCCPFSQ